MHNTLLIMKRFSIMVYRLSLEDLLYIHMSYVCYSTYIHDIHDIHDIRSNMYIHTGSTVYTTDIHT